MEENKETTPTPEVVGNGNGVGSGGVTANGFVPLVMVVGFHHARFVCFLA
jgi:hypothetical protein